MTEVAEKYTDLDKLNERETYDAESVVKFPARIYPEQAPKRLSKDLWNNDAQDC